MHRGQLSSKVGGPTFENENTIISVKMYLNKNTISLRPSVVCELHLEKSKAFRFQRGVEECRKL